MNIQSKKAQKTISEILFLALQKSFLVYNYEIEFQDFVCKAERRDLGKHERRCGFKRKQFTGALQIKTMAFIFSIPVRRDKNSFPNIEFIIENCIRVIRSMYFSFLAETINKSAIGHILDDAIQSSIVTALIGQKKPQDVLQVLTNNICELLEKLSKWANRTYEGRKIPFSFLIDLDGVEKNIKNFETISKFLEDDASALITDGITSYITIGKDIDYKVVSYFDAEDISEEFKRRDTDFPFVPYRFASFGNMCEKNSDKLGIILTVQGDILFIKDYALRYAKRNGDWHHYDYAAFHNTLFKDFELLSQTNEGEKGDKRKSTGDEYRAKIKKVYLTCLDVAFARTGGCLAICLESNIEKLIKCIPTRDIHKLFLVEPREQNEKRYMLEDIIVAQNTFDQLGRKARQELLGIDGATIIVIKSNEWQIMTTGSIIDNKTKEDDKDQHGGARTKITKKLSQYGVAIKISADGYIECYKKRKHIF